MNGRVVGGSRTGEFICFGGQYCAHGAIVVPILHEAHATVAHYGVSA